MNADATLTLRDAVKRYESADASFELHVPELTLLRGEVCVIVGQSGCGKTTLLDALGCISDFTRCGEFTFCDGKKRYNVAGLSAAGKARLRCRYLGYVLQQGGLLPYLTAWENIELPLRFAGKRRYALQAVRLAEKLGIAEHLNKKPAALSIGQRQRVSIVRALAGSPPLLLADEPTGALDPLSAWEVREQLYAAAREAGATLVIVTHDVELFAPKADKVLSFDITQQGGSVVSRLYEAVWAPETQDTVVGESI